jgi:hypothetical protein
MSHKKPLVLGVVAGLIAVGGLTACGDDDESSDTTSDSTALTAEQLATDANAVCKEHNDAINEGAAELPGNPDEVEVRAFIKDYVLPQYTAWIGTLDTYEPPEDLAADWDAWIEASYAARDEVKGDPNLAFDASAFTEVNEQADALGLGAECHAGPTT